MQKIDFSKQARKFFESRDAKQRKQIAQKITALSDNAFPSDSIGLRGFSDYYRVDIGEYRVIYEVGDNLIYIKVIGKRNDDEVYRIFKRLF